MDGQGKACARVITEEILVVGADDLRLHRRLAEPGAVDAPHDGDGHVAVLAHHQLGGGGQLVGQRHLGGLQSSAPGVRSPPQVDNGGDSGAAEGDVHDAPAPRPAEGVGHHHGDDDARARRQGVPDVAGRTVGVDGEKCGHACIDVRQVDAGVGAHEALLCLADHQLIAASEHPH